MRLRPLVLAFALASPAHGAHSQQQAPALRLPRIFGDGMVIQRDAPIALWGWASPSSTVTATLRAATASAQSDSTGAWQLRLPAQPAGGPFTLVVSTATNRVTLRDVLLGDVWLASGQSNMEFAVASVRNAAREISAANDPMVRHFKVPTSWSNAPEQDLTGGQWERADPQHIRAFSAVGWFFAREVRTRERVPIGIINSSWGGSAIEAWMSRAAHGLSDEAWARVLRDETTKLDSIRTSLRAKLGDLPTADAGFVNGRAPWADPTLDETGWRDMPVPSYWEGNGYDAMDGIAWYRTSFTLSDADLRAGITVSMQAIDDDDITWLNGVEIGRTNGYNIPRRYVVPARMLRAGRNVLAVRVADGGGGGGINATVSITRNGVASAIALPPVWKFKVGAVTFQNDGQRINKIPTVLYNRMLHPLLPFSIKGVLWYQGESNANDDAQASAYRAQFTSLIESWRREWRGGRDAEPFPFLWVQLPNYGTPDTVPPRNAAWATQRASMEAALGLPKTGQAITIDVGEPGDIHPRNKQDVGARLGKVALRVAYGRNLVSSGPTYRSHDVQGARVSIAFDNAGGGLMTTGAGGSVGAFAIAGDDRQFVRASARIAGNRVEVWSDRVPNPMAVRYAWSNSPVDANLYNREKLPAAPFRTDRWGALPIAPAAAPEQAAWPADKATPRTDANSVLAHQQLLEKRTRGKIDVYFMGNSIVRRWGATDYPDFLANWNANFFGWNAADFGWGADRIEHMLWRIENGELDEVHPKVIVILAGTNNVGMRPGGDEKVANIARGLRALVDLARRKAPNATIIVTGIFPRNDNMLVMPEINRINANLARFANDSSVRYVNVNDKLADSTGRLLDGMTVDKLHPTVKGYQVWADALKPLLHEILGPPAATDQAPPPTGDPSARRPATPTARPNPR